MALTDSQKLGLGLGLGLGIPFLLFIVIPIILYIIGVETVVSLTNNAVNAVAKAASKQGSPPPRHSQQPK